jgi:hypothetical protein
MPLERLVNRGVDWMFLHTEDLSNKLFPYDASPESSIRTRLLVLSLSCNFVGLVAAWILQMLGAIDVFPTVAIFVSSAAMLVGIIMLRITQSTRLVGYYLIAAIYAFSFCTFHWFCWRGFCTRPTISSVSTVPNVYLRQFCRKVIITHKARYIAYKLLLLMAVVTKLTFVVMFVRCRLLSEMAPLSAPTA